MPTIFISYRRNDASGHAGRLYDRLVDRFGKEKLFRDVDQIHYGEDFVEAIDEAVGVCKAMIVIIGRAWLTATDKDGRRSLDIPLDFVRIEIESALSRDIPIFPILVNGAEMPEIENLPKSISKLAHRQALDISETRFDYDVDQLVKALEVKVGSANKVAAEQPSKADLKRPDGEKVLGDAKLSKELQTELLPASVKHKLGTLSVSNQLRFLDSYRKVKRDRMIAYLLLLLPLPILGLHNSYLGNSKRQYAYWLVSGALVGIAAFGITGGNIFKFFFPTMFIWPLIDLFHMPSMVRRRNEYVAQEIVFGSPDDNKNESKTRTTTN